jgi:tetratricopeptide (TPR) repeat protein
MRSIDNLIVACCCIFLTICLNGCNLGGGTSSGPDAGGPTKKLSPEEIASASEHWADYNKAAAKAYYAGNYKVAEENYNKAIEAVKDLGDKDPLTATALIGLSVTKGRLEKWSESEELLKRAIAIRERAFGDNDKELIQPLGYLAYAYLRQKKIADARAMYKRQIKIIEGLKGGDPPNMVASLTGLASLYESQDDFAEAESLYLRAVQIAKAKLSNDPQLGVALGRFAALESKRGKHQEAVKLLEEAVESQKKTAPNSLELAESLSQLGYANKTINRYAAAASAFEQAAAIKTEKKAADLDYALDNLAYCYADGKDFAKAIAALERSLKVKEAKYGKDSPQVAQTYAQMAFYKKEVGSYGDAEANFRKAIEIRRKHVDTEPLELANTVDWLASTYKDRNKLAEAEPLFKESLEIREKKLGANHEAVMTSALRLKGFYEQAGDADKASAIGKRYGIGMGK